MRPFFVIAPLLASVAMPASAATLLATVTAAPHPTAFYSAPVFTFSNFSSPGLQITNATINGGAPWDFVNTDSIINPAGGTRTLLIGQESNGNPNDGCTSSISYGLTSFDPGDSFSYYADPETPGCGNAVVYIEPFLINSTLGASVSFSDGTTLGGNDWIMSFIDPNGDDVESNRKYTLTLSKVIAPVPEPASWVMMIAGFALVGAAMRRKAAAVRFA